MLIISGHLEVEPSERDEFITERVDDIKASRAEEGCLDYALSADPVDPGRVLIFERWESKEHLAVHLKRVMAPPEAGAAPRTQARSNVVLQHEVSASGPIGS
jgi:quinol monooxygenase YgiN